MEQMIKISDKDMENVSNTTDGLSKLNTIVCQGKWIPVQLADPRKCGYSFEDILLRILIDNDDDGLLLVMVGRVGDEACDSVSTDSFFAMMQNMNGKYDGSLPFTAVTHWMPIPDYFTVEE